MKPHHWHRIARTGLVFAFACVAPIAGANAQREDFIVDSSAQTVIELTRDAYRGVPREVLREAQGVIIIPNMVRAGFLASVRTGRGVVLVRDPSGRWSDPFFIRMTGGGIGLQAGVDANEMLLVFRERRTIDRFLLGLNKLTFGVDATLAAGSTGGGIGASTDPSFRADILAYSRARGLFAGAAINGAVARVDHRSNWNFYNFDATPSEIVDGMEGLRTPASVLRLHQALEASAQPPAARRRRNPDNEPILEPIPGFDSDQPSVE